MQRLINRDTELPGLRNYLGASVPVPGNKDESVCPSLRNPFVRIPRGYEDRDYRDVKLRSLLGKNFARHREPLRGNKTDCFPLLAIRAAAPYRYRSSHLISCPIPPSFHSPCLGIVSQTPAKRFPSPRRCFSPRSGASTPVNPREKFERRRLVPPSLGVLRNSLEPASRARLRPRRRRCAGIRMLGA